MEINPIFKLLGSNGEEDRVQGKEMRECNDVRGGEVGKEGVQE